MKILAKVLDVQSRTINGKPAAQVTFMSGDSVMQAMLWSGDINDGHDKQFRDAVGKEGFVELDTELYKGKLQYKFGFDKSFDTKTAGPALAKAS